VLKRSEEMDQNIRKALKQAAIYHKDGVRKGTDVPYIIHPFEVAMILQENGMEARIIVAGLLHDTLEDTEMTEEQLQEEFGEDILHLVLGASEKLEGRKETLWEERKKHTIEYLQTAPLDVKYIICADKLSNIRSMLDEYKKEGEKLWDRFMNSDKRINGQEYSREYKREKQKWYYENLVKNLQELEGLKMYQELKEAVRNLFG